MGKTIHKFAEEMSVLIPRLHRELMRRQASVLTGEISFAQMAMLHLVKERKVCQMNEIAKAFSITRSAATGIVDRMVRSGFLKRAADPKDRRVINVKLTSKGKKGIDAFLRHRQKMMVSIFGKFSANERQTYLNLVKKVYNIVTRKKSE